MRINDPKKNLFRFNDLLGAILSLVFVALILLTAFILGIQSRRLFLTGGYILIGGGLVIGLIYSIILIFIALGKLSKSSSIILLLGFALTTLVLISPDKSYNFYIKAKFKNNQSQLEDFVNSKKAKDLKENQSILIDTELELSKKLSISCVESLKASKVLLFQAEANVLSENGFLYTSEGVPATEISNLLRKQPKLTKLSNNWYFVKGEFFQSCKIMDQEPL